MGSKKEAPKVNAGSMADIAFLLLIFFLVTTSIETDVGIDSKLPSNDITPIADVYERNILRVLINEKGNVLVDDELTEIKDVKKLAAEFLDNGGTPADDSGYCDYCNGKRNPKSSDNPTKAIISLSSNRETTYAAYITVQNELLGAYNLLRNREAQRLYRKDFAQLEAEYRNVGTGSATKQRLKARIKHLQSLYPIKLLEAETK